MPTTTTQTVTTNRSQHEANAQTRISSMIAAARRRQLQLAQAGRVMESGTWAARAKQLRGRLANMATAATVAAGMLIAAPAWAQGAPTVQTAPVRSEQLQNRHRVTGSLQATHRTELSLQEEGAVRKVHADVGNAVRKGQVIAELDDRRLVAAAREAEAAVSRAKAVIAEREAELALAQSDLEKLEALLERNAATPRETDDARRAHRVAVARLESSQQQLKEAGQRHEYAGVRLEDARVLAPYAGWVIERHVDTGDWVRPGEPVVTIVSSGSIEARLEVPERLSDLVARRPGDIAIEISANGRVYRPMSLRKSPIVDQRARTFPLIAELDNVQGELTAGMAVTAWVPAGDDDDYLTVPVDAVVRSAGQAHVYVVREAEQDQWSAQRQSVRVLFSTGDRVALQSRELAEGDVVVVEGNERLQPGSPVRMAKAKEATP